MTTLSTVGFGDITPSSNLERIIAVFIFFIGVNYFSVTLGTFIDVYHSYE